jgi:hypothetical protein
MTTLTPPIPPSKVEPYDVAILRILGRICEELDIPTGRYDEAAERYTAIAKLLNRDGSPVKKYSPQIYTQGSVRNLTTVKPIKGDEFDVDLICELQAADNETPNGIYDEVKAAILADATYKGMVSEKRRCIRVTYHNEFYLDITPAIPDRRFGPENLRIADRPTRRWKEGNCKDYGDWLQAVAKLSPRVGTLIANSAAFEALLEIRAGIEPLPQATADRPLLNRIIQIFKRHRDIYYQADPKNHPISAIITTLAALAYRDVCARDHENLLDVIIEVAEAMPTKFGPPIAVLGAGPILTVPNPRNSKENFADKWITKPHRQLEFFTWHAKLVTFLRGLRDLKGKGKDSLHRYLATGLGDDVVKRSMIDSGQGLKLQASSGLLGITSGGGLISVAAARAPVRAQTFHG